MNKTQKLSSIDSFFVAYQERSGIPMSLGVALEVRGELLREQLEQMLQHLVNQWPALGQTLQQQFFGIKWGGPILWQKMLHQDNFPGDLDSWRNHPINPFEEPPFQLLWLNTQPGISPHILAFRCHHALVDGLGLLYLCSRAIAILSSLLTGQTVTSISSIPQKTLKEMINRRATQRQGHLLKMWGYMRWLSREAVSGKSARLALKCIAPGPITFCERHLNEQQTLAFRHYAYQHHISPLWLGVAAWMKAIWLWNTSQNQTGNSLISLEIPVSLRGKFSDLTCIGNFIAPLIVLGDARLRLETLARELKQQFLQGIKERAHLAVPFFSEPGKHLPWSLFRQVALSPRSTGFATSHFTWFDQHQDPYVEISSSSEGKLEILAQHIHAPVCLHMGAALFVWALPQRIQLSITHRLNALSAEDAHKLMDLLVKTLLNHPDND